jgi:alanine dehydrogenase
MVKSFGLPRIHKEPGERRDFLPGLVSFLDRAGAANVVIEQGYGSGMGLDVKDYLAQSPRCRVGTYEECLAQDAVLVLRYPTDAIVSKMRPGAVFVAMVHYPTRPGRVELLEKLGVRAVSLDAITDDRGVRLVENLESVGWNGVKCAFRELERVWPALHDPARPPVRALVLGAGAVGAHAVRAAAAWGDRAWRDAQVERGVKGVEVTVVDFDLSGDEAYMRSLLARSDVVVDATLRRDVSKPAIPNAWLGELPPHAVLVDLSVDPYDFTRTPPQVKGLEGVPEGNLDQYVFSPDDPAYDRIDKRVDTQNRRVALSCYSWPGIAPKDCMDRYGKQIEPLLRVLLEKELDQLDPVGGTYFERAVARADQKQWRTARDL